MQVLKILSHLLHLVTQLPRLPVTELPLRSNIFYSAEFFFSTVSRFHVQESKKWDIKKYFKK